MKFKSFANLTCTILLFLSLQAFPRSVHGADQPKPTLGQSVSALLSKGQIEDAIKLADSLVAENERQFGSNHLEVADALDQLGQCYEKGRQTRNAQLSFARSLTIRIQVAGVENAQTLMTLHLLGRTHLSLKEWEKAKTIYGECVKLREKVLGAEHPDTARSLNNLAMALENTGDLNRAVELFSRSLKIAEKVLGDEHDNTELFAGNLAEAFIQKGDYRSAIPLYQRVQKIREKTLGPTHLQVAVALQDLGNSFYGIRDYSNAQAAYTRCLEIREKSDPMDLQAASLSMALARLYRQDDDNQKAEFYLEKAARVRLHALGQNHVDTATTLDLLGQVQYALEKYKSSESNLLSSLKTREQLLGTNHVQTASTLHNLGTTYFFGMEDYAKAEPLLARSLRIRETLLPTSSETAETLDSLASLYLAVGELEKGKNMLEKSGALFKKLGSPDSFDNLRIEGKMAWIASCRGEYDEAESRYSRVIEAMERIAGKDNPSIGGPLALQAQVLMIKGDLNRAEPMLERSLKLLSQIPTASYVSKSVPLASLGSLHLMRGNYLASEKFLEQAVALAEKSNGEVLGDVSGKLAIVKWHLGKKDEVAKYAGNQKAKDARIMGNILTLASERDRLAYCVTQNPYSLLATLEDAEGLADNVLRYKGIVLDSLIEDQAMAAGAKNPAVSKLLTDLRLERRKLQQIQIQTSLSPSDTEKKLPSAALEAVTSKVEDLERDLEQLMPNRQFTRRALGVHVSQVQARLPPGSVLLEFLKYYQFETGKLQSLYGVVLIANQGAIFPGKKLHGPQWIPLGDATEIEADLIAYSNLMRKGGGQKDIEVLQSLFRRIIEPLEKQLPAGTQSLIVAPYGPLNFLSFATLIDGEKRFLAERFAVKYVSSGRDLLQTHAAKGHDSRLVAFGDPDFRNSSNESRLAWKSEEPGSLKGSVTRGDFGALSLSSVPGTGEEVRFLLNRSSAWKVEPKILTGSNATERAVAEIGSPFILHFATHGYFLTESFEYEIKGFRLSSAESQNNTLVVANPMTRSGLVLAGAQSTLEAWRNGKFPPPEDDGVLTAAEVSALDLQNTWLVVLSACDTGLGESRSGEGVLGLKRAFLQAGAGNLLMTLWPISDKWSVDFMKSFYNEAMKSGDASQAMANVQKEWLKRLRREKGPLLAARIVGPFILTGRESTVP